MKTGDENDDRSRPNQHTVDTNTVTLDDKSGAAEAEDTTEGNNTLVDVDDPSVPPIPKIGTVPTGLNARFKCLGSLPMLV